MSRVTANPAQRWRRLPIWFAGTALVVLFAMVSASAVHDKSPAYDESAHAFDAWMMTRHGEYRIAPEDPPLWHYWAALPNGRDALAVNFSDESWKSLGTRWPAHWPFTIQTLYRTPGNDAQAFINRSRLMMVLAGACLGVITMVWAFRLGGAVASVLAGVLFAFDPNLLAHAALVQNDVPVALMYLAVAWAIWRAGSRLTVGRVLAIGVLIGCALCVKMSALLLLPLTAILLTCRACLPEPWTSRERSANPPNTRPISQHLRTRFGLLCGIGVLIGLLCWVVIWGVYRFRYDMSRDPSVHFDVSPLLGRLVFLDLAGGDPSTSISRAQLEQWSPPLLARVALLAMEHRLLPEPYAFGLLATSQLTRDGQAYFLGQTSSTGSPWYFPVTILVKTPLATLLAIVLATMLAAGRLMRARWRVSSSTIWTMLCLLIPPTVYLCIAMSQQFNLGIRHILLIYPFAYIAIGVVIGRWLTGRRAAGDVAPVTSPPVARASALQRAIMVMLGLGLLIETSWAYPNFIPFFNAAAGGSRGGLRLLGDSNLDWGQDLPALSHWQKSHPDTRLFLSYFGTADPKFYGLRYTNVSGGYRWEDDSPWPPAAPGVLAISATNVQGIYLTPAGRDAYRSLIDRSRLIDVLNGSIYLYELQP